MCSSDLIKAGRAERVESIRDGEQAKIKLEAEGKPVVRLSEKDQAEFRNRTQSVYKKFENFFTPGLIDKIKQAK